MATWQESTPCEITTYDEDRWLNISKLEPETKAEAWKKIQKQNPQLAELLKSSEFQMLASAFGADILIEKVDCIVLDENEQFNGDKRSKPSTSSHRNVSTTDC